MLGGRSVRPALAGAFLYRFASLSKRHLAYASNLYNPWGLPFCSLPPSLDPCEPFPRDKRGRRSASSAGRRAAARQSPRVPSPAASRIALRARVTQTPALAPIASRGRAHAPRAATSATTTASAARSPSRACCKCVGSTSPVIARSEVTKQSMPPPQNHWRGRSRRSGLLRVARNDGMPHCKSRRLRARGV